MVGNEDLSFIHLQSDDFSSVAYEEIPEHMYPLRLVPLSQLCKREQRMVERALVLESETPVCQLHSA